MPEARKPGALAGGWRIKEMELWASQETRPGAPSDLSPRRPRFFARPLIALAYGMIRKTGCLGAMRARSASDESAPTPAKN